MAITNRFGAPVDIIAAWHPKNLPGFYLIKARYAGPYPDGSGQDQLGKILHADDKLAQGWLPIYEFRATEGAVEVSDMCDEKKTDIAPKNVNKMLSYWWPSLFDTKGNYKEKRRA